MSGRQGRRCHPFTIEVPDNRLLIRLPGTPGSRRVGTKRFLPACLDITRIASPRVHLRTLQGCAMLELLRQHADQRSGRCHDKRHRRRSGVPCRRPASRVHARHLCRIYCVQEAGRTLRPRRTAAALAAGESAVASCEVLSELTTRLRCCRRSPRTRSHPAAARRRQATLTGTSPSPMRTTSQTVPHWALRLSGAACASATAPGTNIPTTSSQRGAALPGNAGARAHRRPTPHDQTHADRRKPRGRDSRGGPRR